MRKKRIIIIGMAALLGLIITPTGKAYAVNGWDIDLDDGGGIKESSSVTIVIGAGTGNVTLFPESADKNKAMGMIKRTVSVEIGATDGYAVSVSGDSNLTGSNNSNNKIPSISSNSTLAQMNNQWGWVNLDGDVACSSTQSLRPMRSTSEQISSGKLDAKTTKQFTMCFGAKVDTDQAADNYSGTVTVSAVAQPKSILKFSGITKMQEMTPSICNTAEVNDTSQLTDERDGKKYWVTKLKDGNCWMSQDLALSLDGKIVATVESTGGTFDWYGGRTVTSIVTDSSTGADAWDLGEYVITKPATISACSNNSVGLSACTGQFTNVSGWTASTDPNFYKNNGGSSINAGTKTYDAHYLVGNYYQWRAATAGTGANISTNSNATGSICPKGWKLPNTGETADLQGDGSSYFLLNQYGVKSTATGMDSAGNEYNIALSPLFFVRSGQVYPNNDLFYYAGRDGLYWSSRKSNYSSEAYELQITSGYINPSMSVNSYAANTLRCLMQTQ